MQYQKTGKTKLIAFVLISMSSLMLIGAVWSFIHTTNFIENAIETSGEVVSMISKRGENGPTYAPVFSFTDDKGNRHTIESSSSSDPPSYEVGEKISILYEINDEESAKINDIFSLWGLSIIFGIMGVIEMLVGIVFLAKSRN